MPEQTTLTPTVPSIPPADVTPAPAKPAATAKVATGATKPAAMPAMEAPANFVAVENLDMLPPELRREVLISRQSITHDISQDEVRDNASTLPQGFNRAKWAAYWGEPGSSDQAFGGGWYAVRPDTPCGQEIDKRAFDAMGFIRRGKSILYFRAASISRQLWDRRNKEANDKIDPIYTGTIKKGETGKTVFVGGKKSFVEANDPRPK